MDFSGCFAIFFVLFLFNIKCTEDEKQKIEYIPESEAIQPNHKKIALGILKCDANVDIQ